MSFLDKAKPVSKTPINNSGLSFASKIKPVANEVQPVQEKNDLLNNPVTRGIQKFFPGKQVGSAIGTLGGLAYTKAKDLIQGTDVTKNYDLSAPSPLQVGGDIAKGASMVAGLKVPIASSFLGKAGQFGAISAVSGAGKAAIEEKNAKEIAKEGLKEGAIGAATGAAFGLAEKGIRGFANLLGKTGDKIQTSVIKPSQADIKDGFSIDTIKKYNLGGSLKQSFEKTDKTLDTLSKQLNEKLKGAGTTLDLNKVYENTAKRLMGNKLESFGSNTQMEGAIEKLKNEIVAVSKENGVVSIPEAQLVKRASGHFGAWTFGVPTPEATASQKVYSTFYNELKNEIEKASPEGVRGINQEISKLIPVMNALIRRIPVAERNSAISLTDIISLSAAALEPRALALSLVNFASKKGSVGAALGKAPKVGQAMSRGLGKLEPIVRTAITQ